MNFQLQIEQSSILLFFAEIAGKSYSLFQKSKDLKTKVVFAQMLNLRLWYYRFRKKIQHFDRFMVKKTDYTTLIKKYPNKLLSRFNFHFYRSITHKSITTIKPQI